MSWSKYKYIYIGLLVIFIFSSGISYYWIVKSQPQNKPHVSHVQQPIEEDVFRVAEKTKIFMLEKYLICEKYKLFCSESGQELIGSEREQLNGLTIQELENEYGAEKYIILTDDKRIHIITLKDGLCPEHKEMWHLGVNNRGEYVTIYYGPSIVKHEGGIYRVTEINFLDLPQEYQEKIKNHAMEFTEREELIAILDSLSE
ncbi:MAG: hypothetical protein ACOYJ1_10880 [Peptococcales bacterium]|jgi:hypothetical protein